MPARHNNMGKKLPREETETGDAQENKGWQFVNLSQSGPTNKAELRKVVRANAMRYYRKSQRESRPVDAIEVTPDDSPDSSLVRQTRDGRSPWLKDKHHTWPNEWDQVLHEAQSTCLMFGSGNPDPFEALPVKGNSQAYQLVHHCKPSAISRML